MTAPPVVDQGPRREASRPPASLGCQLFDFYHLLAVEADFLAFLVDANDAVDFVGGKQMAVFGVTETTLRAMEVPESLAGHHRSSP
jgi:hypothetical protein